MKLLLFLMDKVAMFLAWYAFFDEVVAVYLHDRPEVTDAKDSSSYGACVGIIAAYAFM